MGPLRQKPELPTSKPISLQITGRERVLHCSLISPIQRRKLWKGLHKTYSNLRLA